MKVPGETEEIKLRHGGKVTGVYEIPDYEFEIPKDVEERRYVLQIAFPTSNFDPQIPMLLTSVIGNIANAGKLKPLIWLSQGVGYRIQGTEVWPGGY